MGFDIIEINLVRSFYSEIQNDSDCNIAIFTSTSIFLLWLGEITHMHNVKYYYNTLLQYTILAQFLEGCVNTPMQ